MFSKKNLFSLLLLIPLGLFSCSDKSNYNSKYETKDIYVMDTLCSIKAEKKSVSELTDVLNKFNVAFDCCSENGEAYQLNKNKSMICSENLADLIKKSKELSQKYGDEVLISSGALTLLWKDAKKNNILPEETQIKTLIDEIGDNLIEITSEDGQSKIDLKQNCEIDTGAFAKGYSLDFCKSVLDRNNTDYAVISMTSSILLYGEKPDNTDFKVQIRDPNGKGTIGTVETPACFLSTSGGYERFFTIDEKDYCHIIDLNTGCPSESDLTSVTVFADSGILTDYMSTKIFIEGTQNIENHLNAADYKIAAFDKNGNSYISSGLNFKKEQ